MSVIRQCLCVVLASALSFAAAPAAAEEDTIPVEPLERRSQPRDDAMLGLVAGAPTGIGLYFMGAVGHYFSVGLYGAVLRIDLSDDPLLIRRAGLRGRYHPGGVAPRGFYLFADVAQVNPKFEKSAAEAGRTDARLSEGLHANAGIGYQSHSAEMSYDVGIGLGKKEQYQARYGDGDSDVEIGGLLYVGLGFGLR
jgi:hypothetical protein